MKDYEVVRQGLIAETDILKRLNHPHLPSIIDVIDREDTFLIVMDYIEGKALDYWLKKEGAQWYMESPYERTDVEKLVRERGAQDGGKLG